MQNILKWLQDHLISSTPLKLGVLFVLVIIAAQLFSPVAFILAPTAQAQEGGMAMMLALLMTMLQQLFKSGNTPQTGNVDEQLPYYASVNPQYYSSPYSSGNTVNPTPTPTPAPQSALCEQSFFLAGSGAEMVLRPETLEVETGACLNLINGTGGDKTMRVYKNDAQTPVEQVVNKEGTFIFRFVNPGAFKFCVKGSESVADICGTTVTVGGN